jgi:negative regulator of flagellin synthesis FlgM
MKVTEHLSPQPQTVEKTKNNAASQKPTPTQISSGNVEHSGNANVEISDTAKLMKHAADLVRQTPDMRADKVAALKEKIQKGNYPIDAAAIADKLVDEHLGANFGKNNL